MVRGMPPQHHAESIPVPQRIAVTGSSGFVGRAVVAEARARGVDVLRLVRRPPSEHDEVQWDPTWPFDPDPRLEELDAVVHLAGAGIADQRWTRDRKRVLYESRAIATFILAEALSCLENPPPVYVQASAIGFYGNRGDEVLTEQSCAGEGFLADLVKDWERASQMFGAPNRRVTTLRMGMVIAATGGAIGRMRPIFRSGLGGRLGSGSQWLSWIARPDLVEIILRACVDSAWSGPINAVSPSPVTNSEFTREFAKVCRRPAVIPAPAPLLRLALGRMAPELLLASQRCEPTVLNAAGFRFRFETLPAALQHEPADS